MRVDTTSARCDGRAVTALDLDRAQQLLLRDDMSIAEVAEELGLTERTLHRHFTAAAGVSCREWRKAQGVSTAAGAARPVFFRLEEYEELEVAARDAGVEPNEYARNAVRAALRTRQKKQ